jgi:hypothetical protein
MFKSITLEGHTGVVSLYLTFVLLKDKLSSSYASKNSAIWPSAGLTSCLLSK